MRRLVRTYWLLGIVLALCLASQAQAQLCEYRGGRNPIVRFETSLGSYDVILCRTIVRKTVDNFLSYVRDGSYTNGGFIHRRVGGPNIFQGGGYYLTDVAGEVPEKAPIKLEAVLPNANGTIAMARTNDPDSATSQWYVNLANNIGLDFDFAVFGEIIAGFEVAQSIGEQGTWNLQGTPFSSIPMIDFPGGNAIVDDYLVYVTNVFVVPEPTAGSQQCAALAVVGGLAYRRRRLRAASRSKR